MLSLGLGIGLGRVGGVSSILNTSAFYAPLTNSLVLTRGTGNPTYTRATNAWEFDNEGKLISVPSTAARFGGARMVRNAVPASENFTGWTKAVCTVPSANVVLCGNSSVSFQAIYHTGPNVLIGERWLQSFRVQYVDIRYVQIWFTGARFSGNTYANFDLIDGDYTAGSDAIATITPVSSGVWDITCSVVCTSSGTGYGALGLVNAQSSTAASNFTGDGVKSVGVLRAQLENVTGQADTTASEYVSVGVISAPFHGAGVDGVKYFNTNKNGSAIAASSLLGYHAEGARTNNLLYARNLSFGLIQGLNWVRTVNAGSSELVTNGTFDSATTGWGASANCTIASVSGELQITITAASNGCYQLVTGLTVGKSYVITADSRIDTATSVSVSVSSSISSAGIIAYVGYNNNSATNTTFVASFTAVETSHRVYCIVNGTSGIAYVDNISIKEATLHASLTATGIDNAANSASTLTAGADDATILQTLTLASAARSFSAYVKRRTGTGNIYMTRSGFDAMRGRGIFDSDTEFTLTNATISGGKLNLATSATVVLGPAPTLGKTYRLTYTIDSVTPGTSNIKFYVGSNAGTARTAAGTYTEDITYAAGPGAIYCFTGAGFTTGVVDNLTIQLVEEDITSLINSTTWTRVKIENTSVTDPSVGFKISTSGDAIDVDVCQDEAGAFISSPIITTTATVTRNADIDAYQTASNVIAPAGTVLLTFNPTHEPSGTISLWSTYVDGNNYTLLAHDGTNITITKKIGGTSYSTTKALSFADNTEYNVAASWGAAGIKLALDGVLGTPNANTTDAQIAASMQSGAYNNALQPAAYIKQTYIWQTALTDAQLQQVTA